MGKMPILDSHRKGRSVIEGHNRKIAELLVVNHYMSARDYSQSVNIITNSITMVQWVQIMMIKVVFRWTPHQRMTIFAIIELQYNSRCEKSSKAKRSGTMSTSVMNRGYIFEDHTNSIQFRASVISINKISTWFPLRRSCSPSFGSRAGCRRLRCFRLKRGCSNAPSSMEFWWKSTFIAWKIVRLNWNLEFFWALISLHRIRQTKKSRTLGWFGFLTLRAAQTWLPRTSFCSVQFFGCLKWLHS